jgi:hypothetical protein
VLQGRWSDARTLRITRDGSNPLLSLRHTNAHAPRRGVINHPDHGVADCPRLYPVGRHGFAE